MWIDTISTISGIIASITVFLLFTSPLRVIRDLYRSKDPTKTPQFLFILTAFNCLFWTAFGYREKDIFITLANLFGLLMQTFYYLFFAQYTYKHKTIKLLGVFTGALLFITLVGYISCFTDIYENMWNGIIAATMSILMHISPMQKLIRVIRTKEYGLLPFDITMVMICNNCAWFTYGLCNGYYAIMIPCAVNFMFSFVAALTNRIYKCKYHSRQEAIGTTSTVEGNNTTTHTMGNKDGNQLFVENKL